VPFEVSHDGAAGCIVASLSGDLDTHTVGAFFAEVLRVAGETGCHRVVSDLRDATINASAADMYWMADALSKKNIQILHRRAIVVSRDQDDYAFWETLCANQGQGNIRIFEDYDEARRWALEKD
jgi:hypothetical protein